MGTSRQQEMKGSKEVSKLMLQKLLLLPAKRNLNTQPECMTMATPTPVRRVPSIQTHSYAGGPRNEISISEPEPLQVLQMINSLQLRARWPLKRIKPAGRSGFLGSVCGTGKSQGMSLPARTDLPHFLHQFSLKRSFWPLKQQRETSALNRLLCYQNCNFPNNSFLGASGTPWPPLCISPSSKREILFLGISHLPHFHHPGTAP